MKYFLLFHGKSGYEKAPQCYVIRTLPVPLFHLTLCVLLNYNSLLNTCTHLSDHCGLLQIKVGSISLFSPNRSYRHPTDKVVQAGSSASRPGVQLQRKLSLYQEKQLWFWLHLLYRKSSPHCKVSTNVCGTDTEQPFPQNDYCL